MLPLPQLLQLLIIALLVRSMKLECARCSVISTSSTKQPILLCCAEGCGISLLQRLPTEADAAAEAGAPVKTDIGYATTQVLARSSRLLARSSRLLAR